jgi:hypothetical protein
MKTKRILFVWILVCASMAFYSCKKDRGTTDNTPVDEKVEQAYQEIKTTADAILLNDDPIGGFEAMAKEYEAMEEVKTVEISKDGLFIEFENEEFVGWLIVPKYIDTDVDINGLLREMDITQKSPMTKESTPLSTKKRVCLINQQAPEYRPKNVEVLLELEYFFTYLGWDVTTKRGTEADLDFHRDSLSYFDVVFDIAHGIATDGYTWILTGQRAQGAAKTINRTTAGQIARFNYVEKQFINGQITEVRVENYAFSERFIRNSYPAEAFKGAAIYTVACQSMGHEGNMNLAMAEAFVDHGKATVYIGWDETNYSGQRAGTSLFKDLLCGETLNKAVENLEALECNWRVDNDNECNDDPKDETFTATLHYYPTSVANYRLFPVDFSFIVNGQSVSSNITVNSDFRMELRPSIPVASGYFKVWYHYCMEGCSWVDYGQGYKNIVPFMGAGKMETLYAQYFNAEGNPISDKKGLIINYR